VVAIFIDADSGATAGDFKATIHWGDGSTSMGTITRRLGGGFQVTGTHTYAAAGTKAVRVSIRDVGGRSTTASSKVKVA
jgi:hypothetical protein